MERTLTLKDIPALALGAGVLGTGGGGNTYVGQIWLEHELRRLGVPCRLIDADDLADDALLCAAGTMGAPTVSNEKLMRGDEFAVGIRALEAHLGKQFDAILCGEVGGANCLKPLIGALQLNLPVVDGDPMGRAFPELQMDTFAINGVSITPMALVDPHGNTVIMERMDTPLRTEQYARSLTIEMGGSAALLMPVVTGKQVKEHLIRGTMSLAQRLGEAVLQARADNTDAPEAAAVLGNGRVLFRGKITDVERRTVQGFARGRLNMTAFGSSSDTLEIVFQNENLVAWHNGEVVCTVPDLICILSLDDGEPIGTESLRYGLRVAVIVLPAARELKTPAALKVVGPAAFGYDVPFSPLRGDLL
jgi:DUF917 family protein